MACNLADEIQVVVFDIGGVLIELGGISEMLALFDNKISVEQLWKMWLTSPAVRDFETGRAEPDEFADRLIRDMSLPIGRQEFLAKLTSWARRLYPGALDVVSAIPGKYKKATLSNTNVLHWHRILTEMQLEGAFDLHFASHLTGRIKPDADAFQQLFESFGCAPSAILFLDDVALNVEAAKKAGLRAMQVQGPLEAQKVLVSVGILAETHAELV